jgi:hypothetical protein
MTEANPFAELVGYPPSEILDYTVEDLVDNSEDISFYLPYQWSKVYTGEDEYEGSDGIGNPCPEDPLTIYWTADLSGGDERVTYKTTLSALLDDVFEGHELWREPTSAIGSTSVPLFTNIRDALQKEVDRLTMWIDNAKPEEKNRWR